MAEITERVQKLMTHVIDHAETTLLHPPSTLSAAVENTKKHKLPPIAVSPLQGQALAIQAQLIKAKNVLEIGTLGGYSTIWFASTGANVTSIEINPKHRDIALENCAAYRDQVEIVLGAALDVLPILEAEGRKFDLIFMDASWDEQWKYFEWGMKLVRKGGCLFVDNVVRSILEDEEEGKGPAVQETLLQKVGRTPGVTASLVPMVAPHRQTVDELFDGYLIAVVD